VLVPKVVSLKKNLPIWVKFNFNGPFSKEKLKNVTGQMELLKNKLP
jgi:hypothetical protein